MGEVLAATRHRIAGARRAIKLIYGDRSVLQGSTGTPGEAAAT